MRFLVSSLFTLGLLLLLHLSLTALTEAEHSSHLILTQEGAPLPSSSRENSPESLIRNYLPNYPFISPLSNSHIAPQTSSVSIIYQQEIDSKTVSADTFAVHAMQTGLLRQNFLVVDGKIELIPLQPFQPGELVQVSATTGTLSVNHTAPEEPTVWQFRSTVSNGSGIFMESKEQLAGTSGRSVALGDLNHDGLLDAFVANDGPNLIWFNHGNGEFIQSEQVFDDLLSTDVVLGDLDGDADLDAFITNWYGPNEVWLNDGQGFFIFSHQLESHHSKAVALGDVDGDGDLDALIANAQGYPNQLFFNLGGIQNGKKGLFANSGQTLGDSYSMAVALGDLDGDHDLDALIGNYKTASEVWLNQGNAQGGKNGFFTDSLQRLGGFYGTSVALGDVDSDGDLDAFLANQANQPNELWFNDGHGSFTDSGQQMGHFDSFDIAFGDLDADNDLDAFVANRNQPNQVWLNQGGIQEGIEGIFAKSQQTLGNQRSFAVALADLNGSGALDAFVTNDQGAQIWFNGEFNEQPELSLTKQGPATAISGQPITYTLIISNSGNTTATNLLITDELPTDSAYVSGGDSFDGEKVTWFVSELAASRYITKQFVVTSTAPLIINSDYRLIADDGIFVQGKEKVLTRLIGNHFLEISKRGPFTSSPNTNIRYTLTITNHSDIWLSNLLITDRVPTHATYITGADDLSDDHQIVSWEVGKIEPNSSIIRQFIVTATQTITNDDYRVTSGEGLSATGTTVIVTEIESQIQMSPPILTDFVEKEVNLVGSAKNVEKVISYFKNLQYLDRITLTLSTTPTQLNYLYQITDITSVESMVISLTEKAESLGIPVTSQPNYLIASSGWRGLGSPAMTATLNVPAEYFNSQWVWQDKGIELFDESGNSTTQGYQGLGIPVALFDNSTFSDVGVSQQPVEQILSQPNGETWKLSVWHLTEPLQSVRGGAFVPGHGYSIASLIHQIAPNAQLHLFRVFNEYGIGDLFTLNQALGTFIKQHEGPGVINLSLGVLADPESVPELHSLKILLEEADKKGFVIIAAAGNWSTVADNGEPLIGAEQYPAKFSSVLSVGGNNYERERSCFSSETSGVSAPAGNWDNSLMNCDKPPTNLEYFTQNNRSYIVALDPTSEETGASAWTGTSFATPLVSGLAALLLQKGEQHESITPDEVINAIQKGAIPVDDPDMGAGIINIPNSLSLIPGGGATYSYYIPLLLAEK